MGLLHARTDPVATSTGGTPYKLPGRVGDRPVIGAGAYAENNSGCAPATGWGESLLKILSAETTADAMAAGKKAGEAAKVMISILEQKVDGRGGIFCIDIFGYTRHAYNTPYMTGGSANENGIVSIGI